jgi:hypothetical protein
MMFEGAAEATRKTYNVNGKILSEKEFAALRQKSVNQSWGQEIGLRKRYKN